MDGLLDHDSETSSSDDSYSSLDDSSDDGDSKGEFFTIILNSFISNWNFKSRRVKFEITDYSPIN